MTPNPKALSIFPITPGLSFAVSMNPLRVLTIYGTLSRAENNLFKGNIERIVIDGNYSDCIWSHKRIGKYSISYNVSRP